MGYGEKIQKNIKIGLVGIVLTASLNGCYVSNPFHTFKVEKKYGSLTKEQIDQKFKQLSPGLKDPIKKVYIVGKEHLRNSSGHTYPKGIICLSEGCNDETLFHEAAHARHMKLKKAKSGFSEEWKEVANFKYGRKNTKRVYIGRCLIEVTWKDGALGPKNGCLRPYSGEHVYEDVAGFVECLGNEPSESLEMKSDHFTIYPLYFCDPKEERYQKKLDLLKEYKFLTEEEHENLSNKLGSLHHLLKNNTN